MLTISLYIIVILCVVLLSLITVCSIHVYHQALLLNPKALKDAELDQEITTKQTMINNLNDEIELMNQDKAEASRFISQGKEAKDFLDNHEAELQRKKALHAEIDEKTKELTKKYAEQASVLNELNGAIAEKESMLRP